jgi:hypothetical protein
VTPSIGIARLGRAMRKAAPLMNRDAAPILDPMLARALDA